MLTRADAEADAEEVKKRYAKGYMGRGERDSGTLFAVFVLVRPLISLSSRTFLAFYLTSDPNSSMSEWRRKKQEEQEAAQKQFELEQAEREAERVKRQHGAQRALFALTHLRT